MQLFKLKRNETHSAESCAYFRIISELKLALDKASSFLLKNFNIIHSAGEFHKDIAGEIDAAVRDFNYQPDVGFEEIKTELGMSL